MRDLLPTDLAERERIERHDLDPGVDTARGVVGHRLVVGSPRRSLLQQHAVLTQRHADEVDVAVGVLVADQPVAEPDDALHAEEVDQPGLDLPTRHRRVAVGVQQALLCCQQRARAVDRDRAALEHERRGHELVADVLDEQRPDPLVRPGGGELPPPRVEAEVHADPPAAVGDEDRPRVTQPGVVDRVLDDLDVPAQRRARSRGVAPRRADHRHRLEGRDRVGHVGVLAPRDGDVLAPHVQTAGPRHQRALVRRPLRRHREARRDPHGANGRGAGGRVPPACRRR